MLFRSASCAVSGSSAVSRPRSGSTAGAPISARAVDAARAASLGPFLITAMRSGTAGAPILPKVSAEADLTTGFLSDRALTSWGNASLPMRTRGGTVAIEINQVGFPEGKKQRPVISAADAAKSIRSGMDDPSLMEKYGISAKGLRSLFRKLVAAGVVQQWELDKRMSETQSWAVLDD